MHSTHLLYAGGKTGAKARIFKAAQLKNHQLMRARPVEENRLFQRKLAEMRLIPPEVSVTPGQIGGVPCEWVACAQHKMDRVILYIHGGSWLYGDLRTARPTAVMLAELCDYPVLAIDYRLAPEFPYPAALEDCFAAYSRLLQTGYYAKGIGVFGDSAGGNLALCLQQMLLQHKMPQPAAISCASPVTDLTQNSVMYRQKPDLFYMNQNGEELDIFTAYLQGQEPTSPLVSPVYGDLSQMPPTLLHVGEDEALYQDNLNFAKEAARQGASVTCKIWPGMFHDFTIAGLALKESRISMREIAEHFKQHLN